MAKTSLVAGGYIAAALLAFCAVWISTRTAAGDAASAGMQAFGDSLLFIAVFALAALLPTGLAMFFVWESCRRRSSETRGL